jgi:hypothetical protein
MEGAANWGMFNVPMPALWLVAAVHRCSGWWLPFTGAIVGGYSVSRARNTSDTDYKSFGLTLALQAGLGPDFW